MASNEPAQGNGNGGPEPNGPGRWSSPPLFFGMRQALAHGYGARDLRADLMAGATVGLIAIPLAMALAIASGVPPQQGLYTAIIAGAVIALVGGSRVQVSGPTAAFVVILAPIAGQYGLGGLLLATTMAGVMLIGMGMARLGRLIEYIPYPVTTGFTAGIAVVIATLQLKDLFGLELATVPGELFERVGALVRAAPSASLVEAALGLSTLAALLVWPRLTRSLPAPLVVLPLAAVAGVLIERLSPGTSVATIADRFTYVVGSTVHHGIPPLPPTLALPWTFPGADGQALGLSFGMVRALMLPALTIALLGAIESLLSAVIADARTGTRHDPDGELVAQGLGNVVAPFFGGIAATGALARTAANMRAGGRSPLAAVVHAAFVLVAVLAAAPLLGYLPMTALAAMLLVVSWNMSEAWHVAHTVRTAPRSDAFVLLTCMSLTIVFDMVVAVVSGVVLASLLFMRRMVEVGEVVLHGPAPTTGDGEPDAQGVLVYRIAGPLFFGAAHRAMSALERVGTEVHTVLFDLRRVPAIDATGLVNLESAIQRLHHFGTHVVLAGLEAQVLRSLRRRGVVEGALLRIRPRWEDARAELGVTRLTDEHERSGT